MQKERDDEYFEIKYNLDAESLRGQGDKHASVRAWSTMLPGEKASWKKDYYIRTKAKSSKMTSGLGQTGADEIARSKGCSKKGPVPSFYSHEEPEFSKQEKIKVAEQKSALMRHKRKQLAEPNTSI
jgi:hypothetical protein